MGQTLVRRIAKIRRGGFVPKWILGKEGCWLLAFGFWTRVFREVIYLFEASWEMELSNFLLKDISIFSSLFKSAKVSSISCTFP